MSRLTSNIAGHQEGILTKKVRSGQKICSGILESDPPQVIVSADGEVPTSGWKDGELAPWVYVVPPNDGIQDFDFIPEAPTGIVLQVISPISGKATIVQEKWMKGLRVHAGSNKIEVALNPAGGCKLVNS